MGTQKKCRSCGCKLNPEQLYIYEMNVFCEDCLMKVGLSKKQCDPWRLTKEAETGSSK